MVKKADIIGLFDLDNCTSSHRTRTFLKQAEAAGQIMDVGEDLPKTFVLVQTKGKTTIYLSQLSTATLQKRSIDAGFEQISSKEQPTS